MSDISIVFLRGLHFEHIAFRLVPQFVCVLVWCVSTYQIAIDFTGSNGRVSSPESLHHVGGKEPNAYMKAIEAVGNVIQEYDRFIHFVELISF